MGRYGPMVNLFRKIFAPPPSWASHLLHLKRTENLPTNMPIAFTSLCFRRLASLAVLVCLIQVAVRSQNGAAIGAPQVPAVHGNDDQGGTIRVNVRLVNVFTTVTDGRGAPVAGLRQQDFRILEDGVLQTI